MKTAEHLPSIHDQPIASEALQKLDVTANIPKPEPASSSASQLLSTHSKQTVRPSVNVPVGNTDAASSQHTEEQRDKNVQVPLPENGHQPATTNTTTLPIFQQPSQQAMGLLPAPQPMQPTNVVNYALPSTTLSLSAPPSPTGVQDILDEFFNGSPDIFNTSLTEDEKRIICEGDAAVAGKHIYIHKVKEFSFLTRSEALLKGTNIRRGRIEMIRPIVLSAAAYWHVVNRKAQSIVKSRCAACNYVDQYGVKGHPLQSLHDCYPNQNAPQIIIEAKTATTSKDVITAIDHCLSVLTKFRCATQQLHACALVVANRAGNVPGFTESVPEYLQKFMDNYICDN